MWRALYLSFYSKDFYRDVAQNWKGLAFSYLLLLICLYSIPLTLAANVTFHALAKTTIEPMIAQMPVMTVSKGRLSIPNPQPYFVYAEEHTGKTKLKPTIIFDTTGASNKENLSVGQALVTDQFIYGREDNGNIRSYSFAKMDDMVIGHDQLRAMKDSIQRWFMPMFFISIVLMFYVARILQALLYGLFGLFFNKIMHAFLDYTQLVRLSVIALTPVLVLNTLLLVFLPTPGEWPVLGFLLAMGYLIFGIRANRELIT